jgi:hypothetical protein
MAEEQLKDLGINTGGDGSTASNMLNVTTGGKDIMIIKQMHRFVVFYFPHE